MRDQLKRTKDELAADIKQLMPREEVANFKKFAFRGEMVKLAIAFILGGAFQKVVTAIAQNLIMPFLNYLISQTGNDWREFKYVPIDGLTLEIGHFLGSFIDFILIAFVLYIFYNKMIGSIKQKKPDNYIKCDFCLSKIHTKCRRCPRCTSWVK